MSGDGIAVAREAAGAADDDQSATKGELRSFKGEMQTFQGEMRSFQGEMRSFQVEMRTAVARIDQTLLELKSERTGVQHVGQIIPPATVVVENTRFFAHVSRAVLRHKGHHKKIVSRFRNSKKYM